MHTTKYLVEITYRQLHSPSHNFGQAKFPAVMNLYDPAQKSQVTTTTTTILLQLQIIFFLIVA